MQSRIPSKNFHGILPVRKEKGYTSNDVVAKLRGILKMKKIGHTGTLDPEAEGVLPILLGRGTKLSGMLTDTDKTYRSVMKLGVETDTQDLTGQATYEYPPDAVYPDEEEIRQVFSSFEGEYLQTPPMYSAKKVGGRKLYELARAGEIIEREPVKVHIRQLTVEEIRMEDHTVVFEVTCSKGTYIRTLCSDIGKKLRCGAAMAELTRTLACSFELRDTLTLSQIEDLVQKGQIEEKIIPLDRMFADYEALTAGPEEEKKVINGNRLLLKVPDGKYRMYLSDGRFAALYEVKNRRAELCAYFLT